MAKAKLKPTKSEAVNLLWKKGILYWKLNSAQKKVRDVLINSDYKLPVVNQSRRTGKSYGLLVLAIEKCLQTPNATVHYVCGTSVMAQKIIAQNMPQVLADCPEDIKPKYFKHDRCYKFHNGAKLQIEGADEGNAERLRGTSTDLGIIDEAGFVKDLEYLIKDILLPQTLTTKGKLILSSSAPRSTGHAFVQFVKEAKLEDCYVEQTIYQVLEAIKDDPIELRSHLDEEQVEILKELSGGENSSTWRREYMCQIISDSESMVVPEFTKELQEQVILENVRPAYYDAYTSMDPGVTDNTGILFGYLDFNQAKLVIEDEYLVSGSKVNSSNIATEIAIRERNLWKTGNGDFRGVYMRISDNEPILLNDLAQLHGLNFVPTMKDDKAAAINNLRIKLSQGKIIINPKCKNLIFQLESATWARNGKTFDRTDKAGHYDLLDALIYMVRMVAWHKNPFPNQGYNPDTHFNPKKVDNLNDTQKAFRNIFIKKRSNK
jgi:hypothetical protein